jgi:hypothetical protein
MLAVLIDAVGEFVVAQTVLEFVKRVQFRRRGRQGCQQYVWQGAGRLAAASIGAEGEKPFKFNKRTTGKARAKNPNKTRSRADAWLLEQVGISATIETGVLFLCTAVHRPFR